MSHDDTSTAKPARTYKPPRITRNTRAPVSLRLPPEFKALCDRAGMTMAQVIQSFAADLCAIAPLSKQTKYVSKGVQAQAAARAYYAAAYGQAGPDQRDGA